MKTLSRTLMMFVFCLGLCLCFPPKVLADGVAINGTNFPDSVFRSYVLRNCDMNGDQLLSENELAAVQSIDCTGMGVSSAKGIEFFPNLTGIYFMNNQLSSLDTHNMPYLWELSCGGNQITSLDLSNNPELASLYCWGNQLKTLDITKNPKLIYLYCHSNQLTSLNTANNPDLTTLDCSSNQLMALDISKNSMLTTLNCFKNPLYSLDIRVNTALQYLNCHQCRLESLDVSHNAALQHLICASNEIASLDLSFSSELNWINCGNNPLNSLDVSHNPKLIWISCYNTGLTTLDVRANPALLGLYCFNNHLCALDLHLNSDLTILRCENNQIETLDLADTSSLLDIIACGEKAENENTVTYSLNKMLPGYDIKIELIIDKRVRLQLGSVPMSELVLPLSLRTIESEAFVGGFFTFVRLPVNTVSIGARAFANCPNLVGVYIPNKETMIDTASFENVTGLTVYGKTDSIAEDYANWAGYRFVAIS